MVDASRNMEEENKKAFTSFDGCPVATEEGEQYLRLMNDEYGMGDMKSDNEDNGNGPEDDYEEH